jgi:hypothetical protein
MESSGWESWADPVWKSLKTAQSPPGQGKKKASKLTACQIRSRGNSNSKFENLNKESPEKSLSKRYARFLSPYNVNK